MADENVNADGGVAPAVETTIGVTPVTTVPATPTAPPLPQVNLKGLLSFLTTVTNDISKINAVIAEVEANPTLVAIAEKEFPGVAPFVQILPEVSAGLTFLQNGIAWLKSLTPAV